MLEILYQDEYLVAVNKPAGWLVHRSWLDRHETVFVMQTLRDQIGQHVFTVHRLDRPTSGVLLFALSSDTARLLSLQFEKNQIQKTYQAVVRGYLTGVGTIDSPLVEQLDKIADKHVKQEKAPQQAISHYRSIATLECPFSAGKYETSRFSLVELYPETGRKHQLRRHLKRIFHPIIGDSAHGDLHQNRAFTAYSGVNRLLLHACSLDFQHPVTRQQLLITAQGDELWKKTVGLFAK